MNLYRETTIRNNFNSVPQVSRLLDLWHMECKKHFDFSIEVTIADKKETKQFKELKGELNTALPFKLNGEIKLVVIVNDSKCVLPIIFTHELGHWLIKLRGFGGVVFRDNLHSYEEIMLNSMAHHIPVYSLQYSVGLDPKEEVDSRAKHNINLFNKSVELRTRPELISNALMIADDLFSCSDEFKMELNAVIKTCHPKTYKIVDKIIDIASYYDLDVPKQNRKFIKKVVQELKLSKAWDFPDEVEGLKKMYQAVED